MCPPRSPTTTAGCPSRLATFGDESATGLPESLSVWLHVWLATNPAAWGTSVPWATGAAWKVMVRPRAVAAAAAKDAGWESLATRTVMSLLSRRVRPHAARPSARHARPARDARYARSEEGVVAPQEFIGTAAVGLERSEHREPVPCGCIGGGGGTTGMKQFRGPSGLPCSR